MTMGKQILNYATLTILCVYFLFLGLSEAKQFLAPLLTAIVLSLVILPLSHKMEQKGIKRGYSSFICVFCLFLISIAFLALISFQIQNFVSSWPKIQETMQPKVEQFKTFVFEHTRFSEEDLEESSKVRDSLLSGNISDQGKQALSFFAGTVGFLGSYLLTFIYIFFLLNYRRRFKDFLLRLFPFEKKKEVKEVIQKSATVAQQYLLGKLILMFLLAVLYSIGLGISGVSNFILVSIIAALLTLIPYIGNMIGIIMALVFGYLTSGETSVLIGIILTFTVAQFVESYVLQPYVVGDKVDLHPFIVILAVIIGGALWGVLGMVLAIPLTAIIAIVCLHVPPLHPFGFLLSKTEGQNNDE